MTVEKWIDYYQLEPHPEGGFFNQVEKSKDMLRRWSILKLLGKLKPHV